MTVKRLIKNRNINMASMYNTELTDKVLEQIASNKRQTSEYKHKLNFSVGKNDFNGGGVLIVGYDINYIKNNYKFNFNVVGAFDKRGWISSLGGKMEEGEYVINAVIREFIEELLDILPSKKDIRTIRQYLLTLPYVILRPTKRTITYVFSFEAIRFVMEYFKPKGKTDFTEYIKQRKTFSPKDGLYEMAWLTFYKVYSKLKEEDMAVVQNYVTGKQQMVELDYVFKKTCNILLDLI